VSCLQRSMMCAGAAVVGSAHNTRQMQGCYRLAHNEQARCYEPWCWVRKEVKQKKQMRDRRYFFDQSSLSPRKSSTQLEQQLFEAITACDVNSIKESLAGGAHPLNNRDNVQVQGQSALEWALCSTLHTSKS
jgi:hypothetical protein